MSLIGSDTNSNLTLSPQGAADYGRNIRGQQNLYTEAGGVSVGRGGKFIAPQGIDLAGLKFKGGKGSSLVINETNVPSDYYEQIKAQSKNLVDVIDKVNQSQAQNLDILSKLTESNNTGGQSTQVRTFLWLALGFMAMWALIQIFGKR